MTKNAQFVHLTPIGAYYATNSKQDSPLHRLLRYLLKLSSSPQLDKQALQQFRENADLESALTMVKLASKRQFISLSSEETKVSTVTLETGLPNLFRELSDDGKVLLADDQGFCLGQIGFDDSTSEQLAALSADIAIVQERHQSALTAVSEFGNIWGVISPVTKHQLSFWPIFIGDYRFVLVLGQKMSLNQPAFTQLIRLLSVRYA